MRSIDPHRRARTSGRCDHQNVDSNNSKTGVWPKVHPTCRTSPCVDALYLLARRSSGIGSSWVLNALDTVPPGKLGAEAEATSGPLRHVF